MTAAVFRREDRLKKKRQAIHCKRRQLDLDDATYRALLLRVAGVTSSTSLTLSGADDVLEALTRLGASVLRRREGGDSAEEWRFVFTLTPSRQRLAKKIYRCAQKIGQKQTPPVPVMPKAWVEGIVRQARGFNAPGVRGRAAAPLETLDEGGLWLVVQILESWARKSEDRRQKTEDRSS